MPRMISRRGFGQGIVATAFSGLALAACGNAPGDQGFSSYGALKPDPEGLIDLPPGFSYHLLSRAGDRMSDGHFVPTKADGMGCFDLGGGKVALVRNHELDLGDLAGADRAKTLPAELVFDRAPGGAAFPGGTTTMICDVGTATVEQSWMSLAGTLRNCAGGVTPWGSWLSCEEDVTRAGADAGKDHGWVFEVPARSRGLAPPEPLRALGRFNHEAVAIDPRSGVAYLTEDRDDGLFYRFLPEARGELHKGGRMQALRMRSHGPGSDARNWTSEGIEPGEARTVEWIDLDGLDSPLDDLRLRGQRAGATLFARGEGITVGKSEIYFACTSGGSKRAGQIMRYRPSRFEGQSTEGSEPATLENFIESVEPSELNYVDNLTVAPGGHVVLCEDAPQNGGPSGNHIRGVSAEGAIYPIARLRLPTELAGVNFSPDGGTMFVNIYDPGQTLAIKGPWMRSS